MAGLNLIDLKERIAVGDPLTTEQRDFLLDLVNEYVDRTTQRLGAPHVQSDDRGHR